MEEENQTLHLVEMLRTGKSWSSASLAPLDVHKEWGGVGLPGAKRDSVLCQLSLPSRFFYCLKILKPHTHARAPNPHLPLVMHEVVELHLPNILHVDLIFILLYTCPTVSGSYVAG